VTWFVRLSVRRFHSYVGYIVSRPPNPAPHIHLSAMCAIGSSIAFESAPLGINFIWAEHISMYLHRTSIRRPAVPRQEQASYWFPRARFYPTTLFLLQAAQSCNTFSKSRNAEPSPSLCERHSNSKRSTQLGRIILRSSAAFDSLVNVLPA
jgi:hypothetical protein